MVKRKKKAKIEIFQDNYAQNNTQHNAQEIQGQSPNKKELKELRNNRTSSLDFILMWVISSIILVGSGATLYYLASKTSSKPSPVVIISQQGRENRPVNKSEQTYDRVNEYKSYEEETVEPVVYPIGNWARVPNGEISLMVPRLPKLVIINIPEEAANNSAWWDWNKTRWFEVYVKVKTLPGKGTKCINLEYLILEDDLGNTYKPVKSSCRLWKDLNGTDDPTLCVGEYSPKGLIVPFYLGREGFTSPVGDILPDEGDLTCNLRKRIFYLKYWDKSDFPFPITIELGSPRIEVKHYSASWLDRY